VELAEARDQVRKLTTEAALHAKERQQSSTRELGSEPGDDTRLEEERRTLSLELQKLRTPKQSLGPAPPDFGGTSISSIDSGSQGDAEHSELSLEIAGLKDRLAAADEELKRALQAHQQTTNEKNAMKAALERSETDLRSLKLLTSSHSGPNSTTQMQPQSHAHVSEDLEAQLSALRSQLGQTTKQAEVAEADKSAADDTVQKLESELLSLRSQMQSSSDLGRVQRTEDASSVFTMLESRHDATPMKHGGIVNTVNAVGPAATETQNSSDADRVRLQHEVHSLRQQLDQSDASLRALREQLMQGKGNEPLSPTSRIAFELEVHELRARLAAGQLDMTKDRYISQSSHGGTDASLDHEHALQQEIQRLSMQLQSSRVMCKELQARMSSMQTHIEMSNAGRDESVQQLEAKLGRANRELQNDREVIEQLRMNDSRLRENATRLEQQLLAANSELTHLPTIKATILDFQKTAESTHSQLMESQSKLAHAEQEQRSLRAELAVAEREIEARNVETKLARQYSSDVDIKLNAANEDLARLRTELEGERAAVSRAGDELSHIVVTLRSGAGSRPRYVARNTSVIALLSVYKAVEQLEQDWASLQKRATEAEAEHERLAKDLAVAQQQLVENTTISVKQTEQLQSARRDELARQLAFLQHICLRIDTECATSLGAIDRSSQVGLSEWDTVAEAVLQQVSRLLTEHRTRTAHLSENAAKVARMEVEINSILQAAGENEERATSSTLRLQRELAAQAALERHQARQQAEHTLDNLRAQHEAQITEQRKMLDDERVHSKQQMGVVVDDYSARIRALDTQVVTSREAAEAESEERELHFAAVCAVLVRAIHGLQHQLAEVCKTSRVVRRMLTTGTGSKLHTDVIELVRACSMPDVPVLQLNHSGYTDRQQRWVSPAASFRAAVIAVMAVHRLQLIASQSWRCYGGSLQPGNSRYGADKLPAIRLWVEEVDLSAVLAALRDRGMDADDAAAELVAHTAVHHPSRPGGSPNRRPTDEDLAFGLERGLRRRTSLALAVDKYTPAADVMNELRKSVLGLSEQLCTNTAAEQAELALQQQLEECMGQLLADDERMKRSEEELRKANEKIGRAKDDQKRARAELAEAKAEVQALRSTVVRSTEAGERAAGKTSSRLSCFWRTA